MGVYTDSPTLEVKPKASFSFREWGQVVAEIYGGALLGSRLDRKLGVVDHIITHNGAQHLVHLGSATRLPQLAIHLDQSVNDGLRPDRQTHTQPVFAPDIEPGLLAALVGQAGVGPGDVLEHGLFAHLS